MSFHSLLDIALHNRGEFLMRAAHRPLTVRRLRLYTAAIALVWTGVFAGLLYYEVHHERDRSLDLALTHARGMSERDVFWVRTFGRQLFSAAGKPAGPMDTLASVHHNSRVGKEYIGLIWRDPVSGDHRAYDIGSVDADGVARIAGLQPVDRHRIPDAWEDSSLQLLASGQSEVSEEISVGGKPVLRLLRAVLSSPRAINAGDLANPSEQEIAVGISLAMPMDTILAEMRAHVLSHSATFLFLWMVGLTGLVLVSYRFSRRLQDRIRIEAALRESEDRFEQMATTEHVGIWELDERTMTTFVNYRMASMLGYGIEEMLGRSMYDFMDEEGLRQASTNFERRRQNIEEQHEFKFKKKDGTPLWTLVSTKPIFDDDGNFKGALGVVTDIGERKRMEEALRESEERMRQLIESSGDVVMMEDLEGRFLIVFGDTSALGLGAEEIVGKKIGDLLDEEAVKRNHERIQKVVSSGEPDFAEVSVNLRGEQLWLQTGWYPVRDDEGNIRAVSVFARNVTGQRATEQKLRAAEENLRLERLRTRIAGDLHDDIGSTLSSTSIFNELLGREIGGASPRTSELIGRIGGNLRDVQQALHDIVWTIDPNNDLLENLLLRLQEHSNEVLEGSGIIVRSNFPEAGKVIRLPMQVRRDIYLVLKEVIHNIVKHSHARSVAIDVELDREWLRLTIADDGIGFDPSSLVEGNGMRSIRRRCETAGGSVRVDSTPGRGTLIAIRVPIA
jgi:PAS domain S-box-containing protein